jgi:mono/diheme cytochrome c family protein
MTVIALVLINSVLMVERDAIGVDPGAIPPAAKRAVDFVKDIQPLFQEKCHKCHGASRHEAGLRLDRRDDALNGGDSGPAFVAGKSGESLLIKYVAGVDPDVVMPPEGEKLSDEQIGLLRAWIDQGAKWPESK